MYRLSVYVMKGFDLKTHPELGPIDPIWKKEQGSDGSVSHMVTAEAPFILKIVNKKGANIAVVHAQQI